MRGFALRDGLGLVLAAGAAWCLCGVVACSGADGAVAATDNGKSSLPFTVTYYPDRVQATNDGDATWRDCRATLQGGYELRFPGELAPGATATWAYVDMRQGILSIPQSEGYARARSVTIIQCVRSDGAVGRGAYTVK